MSAQPVTGRFAPTPSGCDESSQAGAPSSNGGGENGDFVNIINIAFDVLLIRRSIALNAGVADRFFREKATFVFSRRALFSVIF